MHIRLFRPADLPALKAMTVQAFDGVSIDQGIEAAYGPIRDHDWKWRKARHLDVDAERDPAGIFVLENSGAIAGYISTWCDLEGGIGHIPNLVVVPEYRGQGLGRMLIEHAFQHFRQQGLAHAKIETLVQNEVGRGLYTSLGFREVARQIHFVAQISGGSHADVTPS